MAYHVRSNLNLITILTTPKEQPMYVGMIGLVYGTGAILGPIVGGSLSDSDATWRWVGTDFYSSNNLLIIFNSHSTSTWSYSAL